MTEFISEFTDALRSAGFEPKGKVIADDKWHPAFYMGEKKPSGAYSMKIVNGDFAIGCYFTRKDPDNKHNWHSSKGDSFTPEQRKKMDARIKAEQKQKEIAEQKKQQKISRLLTECCKKLPTTKEHPYLKKKGVQPHPVKIREKTNEIIIPLYNADGNISTVQKINNKGGKYLFAGGKKQGSFYPLRYAKDDMSVILFVEGYATAISIRQGVDRPTIMTIDSGNLKHALAVLRKKYPDSKFLICADNDAFTKNPKGEPWNVGLEAAHKAAAAVGGAYIVSPDFSKLDPEIYQKKKPTDFNDLHELLGIEEMKEQIEIAINRIPVHQDAVSVVEDSQLSNQHDAGGDYNPDYERYERYDEPEEKPTQAVGDLDMNFKVLGYNDGTYYYFPFKERQIVSLSAAAHNNFPNLLRLDTEWNWKGKYGNDPKISLRTITTQATAALIDCAQKKGYFKAEEKIRGAGAWLDAGRTVLHCGDELYVDGKRTEFDSLASENTYIISSRLLSPAENPLGAKEAIKLRQICEGVTWENPLSGLLLAGWIVIAPICGLLSFRPHLFINGEATSGKSTVTDKIIKPALGKIALEADGGTTEPKLRQIMEYDARPIVYDEAERAQSFEAVIALARAATNGKTIGKFGQRITKARYCFCFSAVNPPIEKTADETRMVFMTIKKNKKSTAIEDYAKLVEMIEDTLTEDYANRLLARTIRNIDVLQKNIETFKKATRRVLKDPRASELFGTIFAGLYLLSRSDAISVEDAEKWVEKRDWSSYTVDDADTDPVRLLQYLSSCTIRISYKNQMKDFSIGELIDMAYRLDEDADKHLRHYGIAVKDGRVHFAGRSQNLAKLLKDTDWSIKWTRMLANIDEAEPFRMFYFGVGYKTSGVSLPIDLFRDEAANDQPEQESFALTDEEIECEEIPF